MVSNTDGRRTPLQRLLTITLLIGSLASGLNAVIQVARLLTAALHGCR